MRQKRYANAGWRATWAPASPGRWDGQLPDFYDGEGNMRAQRLGLAIALVGALLWGPASLGAQGSSAGAMPPKARVHGFSLLDLATAFQAWAWGTSAEVNPLVAA